MQNKQVLEKLSQIQDQLSLSDKPLPFNEASKYLAISKSYLYKLTHKNKIAHWKPNGKKIYFLKADLNNWLLRNRVSSDIELEQKALDHVTWGA